MKRRYLLASGVVLLASSSGCEMACTLIGCSSGLHVRLTTPATEPFRIEATSGIPLAKYVFDCPDLRFCDKGGAFFADYQPGSATIRVITATDTTTTTVEPSYTKHQPNGSRCGPTCSVATVEVPFPER